MEFAWTWTFIDFEPFVIGFLSEATRWSIDNSTTLLIIYVILSFFEKQAARLQAIKDNRRLSLFGYYLMIVTKCLLYVFSFEWLTQFREKKALKSKK